MQRIRRVPLPADTHLNAEGHSAAEPQPKEVRAARERIGLEMHTTTHSTARGATSRFLDQFGSHVSGVLHGFDRLRFRATLRMLFDPRRFDLYLGCCGVLLKHFGAFAEKLTERVRAAAYAQFEALGRP